MISTKVVVTSETQITPVAHSAAPAIPVVYITGTRTGGEVTIQGDPFELRRLALAINTAIELAELKELAQ